MRGSWGLEEDGWSGGVFVGCVLYDIMVVVSDYSVWIFLDNFRLLSAVSLGLNWRGGMSLQKKTENTNIFSNDKNF